MALVLVRMRRWDPKYPLTEPVKKPLGSKLIRGSDKNVSTLIAEYSNSHPALVDERLACRSQVDVFLGHFK